MKATARKCEKMPFKRYTMDEINAMIDESERQIAAGETISHEDMMREWDEEQAARMK